MDETEKLRRTKYLREAADHARRHVFPGSWIGRLIYEDLIFASNNLWNDNLASMGTAAEIFRLHGTGYVMPGVTQESESVNV